MAFTAGEVTHIANASLDWYVSNNKSSFVQTIQQKPLLNAMEKGKKTFPGGKGDISIALKGQHGAGGTNDTMAGYTHDDSVAFYTPANSDRAVFPWREHHLGMTFTYTEAKIDGISITDEWGKGESKHSKRELTTLINLLDDKVQDLGEQYAVSMNALLWGDGTGDAKAIAGVQSMVTENPTTGSVGGIDRSVAANAWFRNRARTAAHGVAGGDGVVTSSAANGGALIQALQQDYLQLIRFGGKPDLFLAGSDFIDALQVELRANGNYTDNGFSAGKDVSVGDITFKGVMIKYDPTLDDMSMAKRAYWLDTKAIKLYCMEGEWRKQHSPARPNNQFLVHRSLTCTGQMATNRLNSSLVIDIA